MGRKNKRRERMRPEEQRFWRDREEDEREKEDKQHGKPQPARRKTNR